MTATLPEDAGHPIRLARNIGFNLAGQFLVLAFGFLAVRQIDRALGADAVGLIFFAVTLNAVLTAVLDLGISSTLVREIAAGRQPEYLTRLVRTATLFYWAVYSVLAAVLVLSAGDIARFWLSSSSIDSQDAGISLAILLAGSLLALPRSLYSSVFRGLQRMGTNNVIDVGTAATQQLGVAVTVMAGGGLVAVSSWIAISTAAGVAVYIALASRVLPRAALVPGFDARVIRQNREYSQHLIGISVLAVVHTQADKLIASRLLPLAVFGVYGFTFNVLNRGMLLTGAIVQAALPALAALHTQNASDEARRSYRQLQQLVSFVMAVVYAIAPFASLPVTRLVFGQDASPSALTWTLLGLGFYMNATLNMPYTLSLAMGKPQIAWRLNLWAAVVVLPVTVVLVWQWGTVGAAASWVWYHVFAYVYAVPRFARECTLEDPESWFRNVARFILPATVIYGAMWFAAVHAVGASTLSLASAYGVGTVLFGYVAWIQLDLDTREAMKNLASRLASPLQ